MDHSPTVRSNTAASSGSGRGRTRRYPPMRGTAASSSGYSPPRPTSNLTVENLENADRDTSEPSEEERHTSTQSDPGSSTGSVPPMPTNIISEVERQVILETREHNAIERDIQLQLQYQRRQEPEDFIRGILRRVPQQQVAKKKFSPVTPFEDGSFRRRKLLHRLKVCMVQSKVKVLL